MSDKTKYLEYPVLCCKCDPANWGRWFKVCSKFKRASFSPQWCGVCDHKKECHNKQKPRTPAKGYIVFVDRMDGDIYTGVKATGEAVQHALKHGATKVRVCLL